MLKLPEKYKPKEILYRRLILFTFGLGLIVVYMPQIIGFIADAIWVCLPFIIGSLLAFVLIIFCRVLMRFAHYTLKMEHPETYMVWFKIATLVIVLGFIGLMIVVIIPQLVNSLEHLARDIPGHINLLIVRLYEWGDSEPVIGEWLRHNSDLFKDIPSLLSRVTSFLLAGFAGPGISSLQAVISSTFSWIWIIFLAIAFSFVAFFNATAFFKEGTMMAKAFLPEKVYRPLSRFVKMVSEVFAQYIGGTVLECIILATLVSVAGTLFRIPYALLIGIFCGICALVPMFGATAAAVLCSVLLLLQSPGKAVTFLIMFLVIQQVEGNFIYPNVVGKSVGLPPMFVIVSITVGASLAGVMGMIVSIPIASILYGLLKDQAIRKTEQKEELKSHGVTEQ